MEITHELLLQARKYVFKVAIPFFLVEMTRQLGELETKNEAEELINKLIYDNDDTDF